MRLAATVLYLIITFAVYGQLSLLGFREAGFFNLIITMLLSFFAIFFHELGHAIAVRFTGGTIRQFVVIPFALHFGPLRLRIASRNLKREVGGYVSYTPRRGTTRKAHITVAAAGPVANLLIAPAVLLLAGYYYGYAHTALGPPVSVSTGGATPGTMPSGLLPSSAEMLRFDAAVHAFRRAEVVQILARALAILSIGAGVVNLIPFAGSDGASILRALRAKPTA